MSSVQLDGVAKRFGDVPVVRNVSLEIADGEIVALLGPSGSGKTTLLRLIAGFEHADAGIIRLGGTDVTRQSPVERRCGMVFQHYALFPHLDVGANVAYGLAHERLGAASTAARVAEALAMVDLAGLERRPVSALSGGQQQRVALARALAPRPRVLLLDEPLSNLDPSLRERTRRELRALVQRIGITTVLVTHEQEEAFDLADRVALLYRGALEQVGTPEMLYEHPASPAVAGFIGRSAVVDGVVVQRDVDGVIVDAVGARWRAMGDPALQGAVSLHLRPEAAVLSADGPIHGVVTARRFAGASSFLTIAIDGGGEIEVSAASGAAGVGDAVALAPSGTGAHAFAAGA